jgi:hypothetical protein
LLPGPLVDQPVEDLVLVQAGIVSDPEREVGAVRYPVQLGGGEAAVRIGGVLRGHRGGGPQSPTSPHRTGDEPSPRPTRGDELRNASPVETLAAMRGAGRAPLTLNEGISWLLQDPSVLQAGACIMTMESRKHTGAAQVDGRCTAIWISRGAGRDGPARGNVPKVGWCWAANRHSWLGHASGASRLMKLLDFFHSDKEAGPALEAVKKQVEALPRTHTRRAVRSSVWATPAALPVTGAPAIAQHPPPPVLCFPSPLMQSRVGLGVLCRVACPGGISSRR